MANQTDFLELYKALGLNPECGLVAFKRAYRQHVAMRHPDRPTRAPAGRKAAHAAPLQEVIAQYGAAMEFHRRHGRLPGAATPPPRFAAPGREVAHDPQVPLPAQNSPRPSPRRRPKVLVLVAMIAAGVLLWDVAPRAWLTETPSGQVTTDNDADPSDVQVKPGLVVGMSGQDVRAIEGDPHSIHDNLWEYGGSWVRFDHGKVTDWYSSALRPLKTVGRPSEALH